MEFHINEQLGGFAAVEFYLLEETSAWPVVVTDATAGTITLTPSLNDVDGTIVQDTIKIKDVPKLADAGPTWPIDISFTYMARNSTMEQLLEQYANKPGIAIACHNDGSRRLYGTNEQPMYMSHGNDYGEKMESNHGIDISIKGDMRQRPSYYTPVED